MRVVDPRLGAGLVHQARMIFRRDIPAGANDLDGDGPLQRFIMGFVDIPHPAASDQPHNAEMLEQRSGGQDLVGDGSFG